MKEYMHLRRGMWHALGDNIPVYTVLSYNEQKDDSILGKTSIYAKAKAIPYQVYINSNENIYFMCKVELPGQGRVNATLAGCWLDKREFLNEEVM